MLPRTYPGRAALSGMIAVPVAYLGLMWEECSQNPALFCYRIGWQLFAALREPRRSRVPVVAGKGAGEASSPCSTPSATCCTRSTTFKA